MTKITVPEIQKHRTASTVCRVSTEVVKRLREISEVTGISIRVLMDSILEKGIEDIIITKKNGN